MKAAFFLGTAVMMASAGWGSEEYPKLVLRVYDFSGISISDLAEALAETARIYRAAGIELIWTEADPAGPATVQSVVVASIVSSAGPNLPIGVLGRAFPFAVSGNRITLFLDNIRARAKQAFLPFPILLGHALAHELGHVMLGAGAGDHRFPGLMCAEWGPMEFDRIRHGALKFSHSQAVAMRRTLTERLRADPGGTVGSLLEPWLLVASAVGDAVVQSVSRHVPASPACVELNQKRYDSNCQWTTYQGGSRGVRCRLEAPRWVCCSPAGHGRSGGSNARSGSPDG